MEIRVFEFTGLSSLLMSDIDSVGRKLPTLSLGKAPNEGDIEKIAAGMAYREPDGSLFIKAEALRSSLLTGCAGQKFPGTRISPMKIFQATLFTSEEHAALVDAKGKPIKKWEIQIDSGVNKKTKDRIILVRPRIPVWNCTVPFEIDREFAPTNFDEYLRSVETIWNRAGRAVGVGAWRPDKKGKHGRYSVKMRK
jgi:hypothetical protein